MSVVSYDFALSPQRSRNEKLAARYNKLPDAGLQQVTASQSPCAVWEEISQAPDLELHGLYISTMLKTQVSFL